MPMDPADLAALSASISNAIRDGLKDDPLPPPPGGIIETPAEKKAREDRIKEINKFTDTSKEATDSLSTLGAGAGSLFTTMNKGKFSVDGVTSSMKTMSKSVSGFGKSLSKSVGIDDWIANKKAEGGNASRGLAALSVSAGVAGAAFVALAGVVGFLIGQVTAAYEAHQVAASAGASFGGSLMALKKSATEAGMTVEEFGNYIKGANKQMAGFAGSVTAGAKMTAKLAGSIRDSGLNEEFKALGMSTADIVAASADQLEIQAQSGRLEQFNNLGKRDQALETLKYTKSLKVLGELTGDSIEEQRKKREELRSIAMFRRALDEMGPNMRKNMENAAQLFEGHSKAAGKLFRELVAEGVPLSQATALVKSQMPALADSMTRTIASVRQGGEDMSQDKSMAKAIAIQKENNAAMIRENKNNSNFLRASGMEGVSSDISDLADASVSARNWVIKSSGQMMEIMQKNQTNTDKMAIQAADNLVKISASFREIVNSLLGSEQFVDTMKSLVKILKEQVIPGLKSLMGDSAQSFENNAKTVKQDGAFKGMDVSDMEVDFARAVEKGNLTDDQLGKMYQQWKAASESMGMFDNFTKALNDVLGSASVAQDWDKVNAKIQDLQGKGYAEGGMASGPESGYPATLHGNEMVVPLPSEGAKMDQTETLMKLDELISVMKKVAKHTNETTEIIQQTS